MQYARTTNFANNSISSYYQNCYFVVVATSFHFNEVARFNKNKKKMTISSNEITPYIKKIQKKYDEAQSFLVKNGFYQATKGLMQDIKNANGIDKKTKKK